MADPVFSFEEAAGRFRDAKTGRFVKDSTVRATVDQIADRASEQMATISRSLVEGKTTLAAWEADMRRLVKDSNSATAVIANGGFEQMSRGKWGAVGMTIRQEHEYLHAFAQDIESGAQKLNGQIVSRARQYGQNARTTFENTIARGDRARGYTSERNILSPGKNCAGCEGEAARGWVGMGELIPIGSRTCKSNCRCRVERRKSGARRG